MPGNVHQLLVDIFEEMFIGWLSPDMPLHEAVGPIRLGDVIYLMDQSHREVEV